jgi:histone H3/H4
MQAKIIRFTQEKMTPLGSGQFVADAIQELQHVIEEYIEKWAQFLMA